MFERIEADGSQPQGIPDPGVNFLQPERLEQPQDLDVLPLAGLAHARFKQPAQRAECLGQLPPGQGRRLIQCTDLLLNQRQVMQRVEDQVLPLAGAPVTGNLLRPAGDDHLVHVAPNQHLTVAVSHGNRVVVAPR